MTATAKLISHLIGLPPDSVIAGAHPARANSGDPTWSLVYTNGKIQIKSEFPVSVRKSEKSGFNLG